MCKCITVLGIQSCLYEGIHNAAKRGRMGLPKICILLACRRSPSVSKKCSSIYLYPANARHTYGTQVNDIHNYTMSCSTARECFQIKNKPGVGGTGLLRVGNHFLHTSPAWPSHLCWKVLWFGQLVFFFSSILHFFLLWSAQVYISCYFRKVHVWTV